MEGKGGGMRRSGIEDRRRSRPRAVALGALLGLFWTGVVQAELQRVEAVGIYGIRDGMRSKVIPRDEAIARARWEGVSRVALELIGESGADELSARPDGSVGGTGAETRPGEAFDEAVLPPIDSLSPPDAGGQSTETLDGTANGEEGDQLAMLEAVLGKDVLPYMRSYRILEDRGEVPVLFNDDPDVTVEYVVVVEVIVDVDRVTRALEEAGLIVSPDSNAAGTEPVIVELIGLSRFEAYQLVVDALRDELQVTRVRSLEFARGRQILAVDGPYDPEDLSARLTHLDRPRLELESVGIDPVGRRILLVGRWIPESDASGPADGGGAEAVEAPRS